MTRAEQIIDLVCKYREISVEDLRSRKRPHHIAHARQEVMVLLREDTGQSYPQVARVFGLDHTTAVHASEAVAKRMRRDDYRNQITELRERVRNTFRPGALVFRSRRGPEGIAYQHNQEGNQ